MTIHRNITTRPSVDASSSSIMATDDGKETTTAATIPATGPAAPAATPLPPAAIQKQQPVAESDAADEKPADGAKPFEYPKPKLRLEVRDINHEGADVFLQSINAAAVLAAAVGNVQRLLYGRNFWHPDPDTHMTPTRSVTVILRSMGGVAYTTGSEIDGDHKEIHFSLEYIAGIRPRKERATAEIAGVLTHELVHCYQWNGHGSCPGGLIEGIADWVRLRCALEPPHWKREPAAVGRWDGGYQHTAYFLDYLENRFGSGTVRRINEKLRLEHYDGDSFWPDLLGDSVQKLWEDYAEAVKEGRPEASDSAAQQLKQVQDA
ncbi:pbsp domain-containing protein [Ophiostoma piceae UAMH 11346]|uniref:Pbsp domain-containing protein n=1 Tax=Ophiostoma piceae (strain UAMH 11346) TaxID=1262450 RepID=S3CYP9_OPHP1|nr:pbsp domain-containing protein [Ophiostoma piceae UAMH 11346]